MGSMIILDKTFDKVIQSNYLSVKMDYSFAIQYLKPLIFSLDFQRRIVDAKFYERLKKDIENGCIMPPITIAFNDDNLKRAVENNEGNHERLAELISEQIGSAFILDGIQRINILTSIDPEKLDLQTPLFANIIFSDSMNKLLYRMVILNNGQKPMSPRHQIEILMRNDLGDILPRLKDIGIVVSEKEQKNYKNPKNIKEADLIKGYLAYVTKSVNIDNQKIIESKLDEIITGQIISSEVQYYKYEFSKIINYILELIEEENEYLNQGGIGDIQFINWIKNENNLIGFCSGVSKNPDFIDNKKSLDEVIKVIALCEEAFKYLNVSKFKVGNIRRQQAEWLIINFEEIIKKMDFDEIVNNISNL